MPSGTEIVAIGDGGANVNPVQAIGKVARLLGRLARDVVELSEAADVSEHLILRQFVESAKTERNNLRKLSVILRSDSDTKRQQNSVLTYA
jgi:hypothetical protein